MTYYGRARQRRDAGIAAAVLVVLLAAAHSGHAQASSHPAHASGGESRVVRVAIGYARHQAGKPYCWGGTGPSCYDCSGLVMEAYDSAGVSIERTSQDQWATLPHVPASRRAAGMLVFAPGQDGTWASPGHVGILLGRNTVEQAYATGWPIDIVSLSNFAANAGGIVGYASPS